MTHPIYAKTPDTTNDLKSITKCFTFCQVHGYSGRFVAVVSCVTEKEPYKPHPNVLIGPNCKKGVCSVRVYKSNSCEFHYLIIHKVRKRDFESRLKKRKAINVDPYQSKFLKYTCINFPKLWD